MKKVYTIEERVLNGTVTVRSEVSCFASSELAKQVRRAAMEQNGFQDPSGLKYFCSEVKETVVYETAEEVPLLNPPADPCEMVRETAIPDGFVRWMPGYVIRNRRDGRLAIVEYDYALAFWGNDYKSLSICELGPEGDITLSWAWAQYDDYELVDDTHAEENIAKVRAYNAGKEPPYFLSREVSMLYYGKESSEPPPGR